MKNVEIKVALKKHNMKQWELAELLGITEWTLSKWFKHELPEDKKNEILKVVKENAK